MENKEVKVLEGESAIKPKHYHNIDPFTIADLYGLNMRKGDALKYILRAGKKYPEHYIQDLEKAIRCLELEIQAHVENTNKQS